jgi:hypothetical protein
VTDAYDHPEDIELDSDTSPDPAGDEPGELPVDDDVEE